MQIGPTYSEWLRAEEIRKTGKSVSTMKKIPQKLKSREVIYLKGGEDA